MICWRREATVRQGHLTGGRRFARDIAAHGNARGTFRADHARFGQLNRLLWLGEFADLTARAAWQARAEGDAEAGALPARGLPRLADGSVRDSVLAAL